MITLSLDECGNFEDINEKSAVFVGGVLYNDNNDGEDIANEKKRIEAYYRAVCAKENATYPNDIHAGKQSIDKAVVSKVKKEIKKSLGEFLLKGTYCMEPVGDLPERKGQYFVYAIVKSNRGMVNRINANAGFLVHDRYGSNLYFHMISETLKRTIFQNPYLGKKEHFRLEIATRVSSDLEKDSTKAKELVNQGHSELKKYQKGNSEGAQSTAFYLTNFDVYRSVLEQYLIDENPNHSAIDELHVTSIDYRKSKNQEFLYLADSICSVLNVNKVNSDENKIKMINERAEKLVGKENALVFWYDSADVKYVEAYNAYQNKDYVQTLKIIYDCGLIKEDKYHKFYMNKWHKLLAYKIANPKLNEQNQIDDAEVDAFARAIHFFRSMRFSNEFNANLGGFILKKMEPLAKILSEKRNGSRVDKYLYYFYDLYMTVYCHLGDSVNAEKYYLEAKKYAYAVSTEDYLVTRNMFVVMLTDSFQYEKAKNIAMKNLEYTIHINDLKKQIDGQWQLGAVAEGKAYSQLGQVYALLDNPEAEKCFISALQIFDPESADYSITESYLMHYYIMKTYKKNYEKYAKKYFNNQRDLREQLRFLLTCKEKPVVNPRFGLYVYLKALYTFYRDEVKQDDILWDLIKNLNKSMGWKGKDKSGNTHPFEMIYKYIELLAIDRQDYGTKDDYAKMMKVNDGKENDGKENDGKENDGKVNDGKENDAKENDGKVNDRKEDQYDSEWADLREGGKFSPLITSIRRYGEIQIEKAMGEKEIDWKNRQELYRVLSDCYPAFSDLNDVASDEEKIALIAKKLVYMYN